MREAVLTVSNSELAALGIGELVSLCRAAGLRNLEELACRGDGAVVQVEVETPLEVEHLLNLKYVNRCDLVSESAETHLYVVAFTAPELSGRSTDHAGDLIGTCDPIVNQRGATLSLVGPQEAIRGTIAEYEKGGISPDLRKLGAYDGRERPLDGLTDRQRQVIRLAHRMGYYEVPRKVSTGDVAAELDVDPSTVAEHLQRAERNLLHPLLSSR